MPEENKSLIRSMVEKITAMQVAVAVISIAAMAAITWFIVDGGNVVSKPNFISNFAIFLSAVGVLTIALILASYITLGSLGDGANQLVAMIARITPMQIVATLIGLLTIGGMVWVIYTGAGFFDDSTKARGLLTYSVAIVTVAIALILVFYLVFGEAQELKDRFTFGKDILMVFVGILGTIMGFYYGADKVTTKDISAIASTVQSSTSTATSELEKKAFDLLLKQDFGAASKAFDDVYTATPASPNINNIIEIRRILASKKEEFANADDGGKKKLWTEIQCTVSNNKLAAGMTKEITEVFDKTCKAAAASPSPSTNPNPTQ